MRSCEDANQLVWNVTLAAVQRRILPCRLADVWFHYGACMPSALCWSFAQSDYTQEHMRAALLQLGGTLGCVHLVDDRRVFHVR